MRRLFVMGAMWCCLLGAAQSPEMEQLQLDIEKLAQFRLILSQMKQGYETLEKGYNAVRDAAKGNYDLHKAYLDGLLVVGDAVRASPALKRIASDQAAAVGVFEAAYRELTSSGLFTIAELLGLRTGYEDCLGKMNEDVEMLSILMRSGVLRMSDAERLEAIQTIQADVAGQLAQVKKMVGDFRKLQVVKKQQRQDLETVKRWNGIQ